MKATAICIILAISSINLFAQIKVDDLDGNNTSACYSTGGHCQKAFQPMTNTSVTPPDTYNIVPGNVSTISIKNLLYSPATSQATKDGTKVFAHLLGWFCTDSADQTCTYHVQTGYNSNDVATLAAQHQDMVARGFDGAVLDWYGQGNRPTEDASHPRIDGTAQKLRAEVETSCTGQVCSFQFALMEDFGGWKGFCLQYQTAADQQTCVVNAILEDTAYANAQYFPSPAYLRVGGQPVIFFFVDQTAFPGVDWTNAVWPQVKSGTLSRGNPLLVFRNRGGFQDQHGTSDGAYAWVNCNGDITNTSNTVQHCGPIPGGPLQNVDPYGFNYLHDFYNAAKDQASQQRLGGGMEGLRQEQFGISAICNCSITTAMRANMAEDLAPNDSQSRWYFKQLLRRRSSP